MDVRQKVAQLKQLRYLKGEVILLSQRLERLEAEIERTGRARWRGRPVVEHGARLVALRERLAQRRADCMVRLEALCAYIDGIDDSLMRRIMAGRYIDGLTWKGVAACIGERDEQYPRRLHNRFLANSALPEALTGGGKACGGMQAPEGREDCGKANG